MSTATVLFHQAVADRLGLNASDHKALDVLLRTGAKTAGELADVTGLTTGAITGLVDRLERAGFVRREHDPEDRRRVIIHVQSDAVARIAPVFESLARAVNHEMSRYDDQELAFVLEFMKRTAALVSDETRKLKEKGSGGA